MPKTKLQKQLSRKVGNKEYAKWVLVVPPSVIEELGWCAGERIEHEIHENKLLLWNQKNRKS